MKISTQILPLFLITILFFVTESSAQVTNTSTTGNFNNSSIWNNGVPTNSGISTINDPVTINQDITIEGCCTANATFIDNAGGSQYKAEIKTAGIFTIQADVTFEDEVKFSNNSSGSVNGSAIFTTGDLLLENNATLYISHDSKLIVNGNLTIKNNIGIQNDGELIVNGDIDASNNSTVFGSGSLDATGCVSFNNSASIFGSSSDCCNCTFSTSLPVKLLSFEASIDHSSTKLTWTTASEINNDFFTVEKSANGIDFEVVSEIPGSGNSENLQEYMTYDENPINGTSYYRLKQTDFDGKTEYFKIVPVSFNVNESELFSMNIYPNPCIDNCTINLKGNRSNNQQIRLELYNTKGKRIENGFIPQNSSNNKSFRLNPANILPTGIYTVKSFVGETSQSSRLIINQLGYF